MQRIAIVAALGAALSLMAQPGEATIIYARSLTPEAPGATGSGFVTVTYDEVGHTFQISANWSGLSGTTTVAHIHCCTAVPGSGTIGVAFTPVTLPGFPAGFQTAVYNSAVLSLTDLDNFTTGFKTAATNAGKTPEELLIQGIENDKAYFNVHSSTFLSGEIRGFLQVPEPATLVLLSLGLVGLASIRSKRR